MIPVSSKAYWPNVSGTHFAVLEYRRRNPSLKCLVPVERDPSAREKLTT